MANASAPFLVLPASGCLNSGKLLLSLGLHLRDQVACRLAQFGDPFASCLIECKPGLDGALGCGPDASGCIRQDERSHHSARKTGDKRRKHGSIEEARHQGLQFRSRSEHSRSGQGRNVGLRARATPAGSLRGSTITGSSTFLIDFRTGLRDEVARSLRNAALSVHRDAAFDNRLRGGARYPGDDGKEHDRSKTYGQAGAETSHP